MEVLELISELHNLDVEFFVEGDKLRCNAPKGILTPEIKSKIADHKPEIINLLKSRKSNNIHSSIQPISPLSRNQNIPLSFSQQRLWFINQLESETTAYNSLKIWSLIGEINIEIFHKSLNKIVYRHEILRTNFKSINGEIIQVISPNSTLRLPIIGLQRLPNFKQLKEIQRLVTEAEQKPFDIVNEPLIRVTLLRLNEQEHIFLLGMHHMITDGWSMGVFIQELSTLYQAFCAGEDPPLKELPIQYADFAVWQRELLQGQGQVLQTQLAYWKQQLGGQLPVLNLPTDYQQHSTRQDYSGKKQSLVLSSVLTQELQTLSQKSGVTLFMTLLATFAILLSRQSGQEDIIVGTPIAGRNPIETERLIGLFLKTLVLRTDLNGNPTFTQLLRRVQKVALEAYTHQDLPFEKLVEELQPERSLTRHPIFDVMFNFNNTPQTTFDQSELSITPLSHLIEPESKFLMTLYVQQQDHQLYLNLVYQKALFSAERMSCFLNQYQYLLEQIVADPNHSIQSYSLLTPQSHSLLPNPKITLPVPEYELVTAQFAAWVQKAPEQAAICQGSHTWSYQQLSQTAQAITQRLIADGIKPGQVVGVCGDRSFGMIASLLGVLSSGAVLLTLDLNWPKQRQQFCLTTAKARYLLYVGKPRPEDQWMEQAIDLIFIDPNSDPVESQTPDFTPQLLSPVPLSSEDAAYIFFTSGTTGVPKGILGSHQGLSHFLHWQRQKFDIQSRDRAAQLTSISFDVVLRDIFLPLTSGATLCLPKPSDNLSPDCIIPWLEHQQISLLHTVPALAQSWLSHLPATVNLKSLRWVFFAGEPLSETLVHQWRNLISQQCQIVNLYGPTETTLAKCYYPIPSQIPPNIQPVGFPLPQTQVLVVKDNHQFCGIGEPGEIVIRTPFRTFGYINASEEEQRRFVKNPFRDDPQDLLYYTGDLGRYRPDGSLEILGRKDFQVKIRGIRVELGEIETVLVQHPDVEEIVVIAQEYQPAEQRLVAYYVSHLQRPTTTQLRSFLKSKLPEYMIPAAFVPIDAIPLTPNGKIDRRHLPAPESQTTLLDETFIAPTDELEQQLVHVWQQVLGQQPIGITDNFFELGGHSLLAIKLFDQIEKQLDQKLPLSQLFQSPTIQKLASLLRDSQWKPSWSSLVPIKEEGSYPPLFCVHPIGGEIFYYRHFSRYLEAEQPIYALRAQGLDGQNPPHICVEEMATHYIQEILQLQPQGPYFLCGFCSGGHITLEIAQQLIKLGHSVRFLAMLDSAIPDERIFKKSKFQAHDMHSEYTKKVVDANRFALNNYFPKIYLDRIFLFQCDWRVLENISSFNIVENNGKKYILSQFILGGCELYTVSGEHANIFEDPNIQALSNQLNFCLKKARIEQSLFDNKTMISLYKKAIGINTYQPFWIYKNLGYFLEKEGRFKLALARYKKAFELQPFWIYKQLGRVFKKSESLENALVFCEKIVNFGTNIIKENLDLSQILNDIQDNIRKDTIEGYLKALELHPIYIYQHLKLILKDKEQSEAILIIYRKAIDSQPYSPDIYQELGDYQLRNNQVNEAISNYSKAVELNPNSSNYYCSLGDALTRKGEKERAREIYDKAIKLNPSSFQAHQKQGNLLRQLQEFDQALESYKKAAKLRPEYHGIYCSLGRCYIELGKLEVGKAHFQQAIDLIPYHPMGHQGLGDVFRYQGDLEQAIGHYENAIKYKLNFAPAYWEIGRIKNKQGKLEEAINNYEQLLILNFKKVNVHLKIGNCYHKLNDIEKAVIHYQKSIKIAPDHFEAHKTLGFLFKQQGKMNAAISSYQSAAKIKPEDSGIYRVLGNAQWKKKDVDEAIVSYQKSIKINPEQPFGVYKNLADALSQKGREEEAILAYRKALKLQPDNSVIRRSLERASKSIEKRSSAVEST